MAHSFRIRELAEDWGRRHGRRLSMKELASRTGISPQVLSKMTDPQGYVTNTRYVESLCRFFGVGPSELIVFHEPEDPGKAEAPDTQAARPTGRPAE